jgi:sucrose-6-phosphate hydrolase SacC (GH32 family)
MNRVFAIGITVTERQTLRGKSCKVVDKAILETAGLTIADDMTNGAFEVLVEYEPGTASEFGLVVWNKRGEKTTIGYEVLPPRLFVDRQESGVTDFDPGFAVSWDEVTRIPESDVMRLEILVDRSSIEVSERRKRVDNRSGFSPQSIRQDRVVCQGR